MARVASGHLRRNQTMISWQIWLKSLLVCLSLTKSDIVWCFVHTWNVNLAISVLHGMVSLLVPSSCSHYLVSWCKFLTFISSICQVKLEKSFHQVQKWQHDLYLLDLSQYLFQKKLHTLDFQASNFCPHTQVALDLHDASCCSGRCCICAVPPFMAASLGPADLERCRDKAMEMVYVRMFLLLLLVACCLFLFVLCLLVGWLVRSLVVFP